jgi:F0F1-type ATP synthase membrane subunit b/b'
MDETIQPQMGEIAFEPFDKVWAIIQRIAERHEETERTIKEIAEQHKETERRFQELAEKHEELAEQHKETERFLKESKAETERFLKESKAETDKAIAEMSRGLNRTVGKLWNRLGELVEHLVSPNLLNKFNALNYAFSRINTRVKYEDAGKTLAEVDVLLENGDIALAVEIKADPSSEDVKDHIRRMNTLRGYADARNDTRKYIGAIAGGIVSDEVRSYAQKCGFYVLEQSGDTMNIAAAPEAWKPKRW